MLHTLYTHLVRNYKSFKTIKKIKEIKRDFYAFILILFFLSV